MSTASMRQSATPIPPPPYLPQGCRAERDRTAINDLLAIFDIRAEDRVLLVGTQTGDRLAALVRRGCRSVMAFAPSHRALHRERADVLWLCGIDGITPQRLDALLPLDGPRLVIIEAAVSLLWQSLEFFLQRLRQAGYVPHSYGPAAGRLVVKAQRMERRQWLA